MDFSFVAADAGLKRKDAGDGSQASGSAAGTPAAAAGRPVIAIPSFQQVERSGRGTVPNLFRPSLQPGSARPGPAPQLAANPLAFLDGGLRPGGAAGPRPPSQHQQQPVLQGPPPAFQAAAPRPGTAAAAAAAGPAGGAHSSWAAAPYPSQPYGPRPPGPYPQQQQQQQQQWQQQAQRPRPPPAHQQPPQQYRPPQQQMQPRVAGSGAHQQQSMGAGDGGSAGFPPNAIIVNKRQEGNPVLKYIRNVRWQFGDIVPDYLLGKDAAALFISLRYHLLKPDYIHTRIRELQRSFRLRLVLCHVDTEDAVEPLAQVTRAAIGNDCTLICGWSNQECARYLETFKSYENKPAEVIQKDVGTDYVSRATAALTTVRGVNKTDVKTLGDRFGSIAALFRTSAEELKGCPGIGPTKAKRLLETFHEPFRKNVTAAAAAGGTQIPRPVGAPAVAATSTPQQQQQQQQQEQPQQQEQQQVSGSQGSPGSSRDGAAELATEAANGGGAGAEELEYLDEEDEDDWDV